MKLKSALSILSLLMNAQAALATCAVFEDHLTVKLEIAGMIVEKSLITGPGSVAVQSVLGENIIRKLAEYKDTFGAPIDEKELEVLVKRLRLEGEEKLRVALVKESKTRVEEDSAHPYIEIFNEKLGELEFLRDQYIATQGGLQWSADEKYILFRAKGTTTSTIFDLQSHSIRKFESKRGMLSSVGNFYASTDFNASTVLDLDSGKIYGPFTGTFSPSHPITDQHMVLTDKDDATFILDYKNNVSFKVADSRSASVNVASDYKRVVVTAGFKKPVEVWDVGTQSLLKSYDGENMVNSLSFFPPEIIAVYGKGIEIVRVSDLKHFSVPSMENFKIPKISGDGQKVIMGGLMKDASILNMATGVVTEFRGYTHNLGDGDNYKHRVIMNPGDKNKDTIIVDLDTMEQNEYDWPVGVVSEDGLWLRSRSNVYSGNRYLWSNLATKKSFFQVDRNWVTAIPGRALILVENESNVYLNQLGSISKNAKAEDFQQLHIGHDGVAVSPSGEYVVTYDDAIKTKIKILKVNRAF